MKTKQEEKIELTPVQLDRLFHDVVDLINRHGCFSGSTFHEADDDKAIELTANSLDDEDLEIVATVYVRGKRLKEIREGGE